MKVVDVHTHMLNEEFLRLLKKHGGGYKLKKVVGGQTGIFKDGAPFMTLMPGMFDYELRIRAMDETGARRRRVALQRRAARHLLRQHACLPGADFDSAFALPEENSL